jgi:hypothetical protein
MREISLKMRRLAGRGIGVMLGLTAMAALVAPHEALARQNFTGTVVGECVDYNNVTYNVTATITALNWTLNDVTYVFNPTPPASQFHSQAEPNNRVIHFSVPPGNYVVNVVSQATYSITAPDCSPPRKGMTWKLVASNVSTGTIAVGCAASCDAYQGDTECTTALPLLCIKKAGAGFPLPLPASVDNSNAYYRWSGGVVGTTKAAVPPATLAAANSLCIQEFGAGWRVAEFHDGWGWDFQAYGGVGDPSKRFWVHIKTQSGANCWH